MNQRTWIFLAVFLVIAIFGLFFINQSQEMSEEDIAKSLSNQPSSSVTPTPTKKSISGTATSTQTYTKLVKEYEGKRIQFDINCQAIPSNVTYKNGTKVMFDNRSGDARTITVGGTAYYFAGYGYKILTLSSSILPKNLLLSCGSAVNVGQILLQQ